MLHIYVIFHSLSSGKNYKTSYVSCRLSLKHREKCRTKPDQWQHFYYLRDSILFWCQRLLLSMILSAFIRIGSEGENVGVRSVKLLQQKVGHQVELPRSQDFISTIYSDLADYYPLSL